MWGRPPFSVGSNCAIDVRNLGASREWYAEKLGFREAHDRKEDDSGRPFADLHIGNDDTFVSLVELPPGTSAEDQHVIFFANNLEKAHKWLAGRGVIVEPITNDSGGNRLFRFRDLEGNSIEVCVEPG
jgi:catechol 2,3-dioxygenase-like lactoylglutathione lyase family enzyme